MLDALLDTDRWHPKDRSWLRTFVKVLLSSYSMRFCFKSKNLRTVYVNILFQLIL